MDRSCLRSANPGRCGFFFLGMFFMLALASWTIMTSLQPEIIETVDITSDGNPEHGYSDSTFDNVLSRQAAHKQRLAERLQSRLGSPLDTRTARPPVDSNSDKDEDGDSPDNKQSFERIPTFLATMQYSFVDVHPDANGEIPTMDFLHACAGPKKLLTSLGTIMTKVWADVGGNIEKLTAKYESDPSRYASIEDIIREDIKNGVPKDDTSAAMAVLWLKRAYDFVAAFFDNMRLGKVPHTAAVDAYDATLAPYHSWYLRPIFYGGMKMLGSTDEVLSAMAVQPGDERKKGFKVNAFSDAEEYTAALKELLVVLDAFIRKNGLNI